MGGEKNYDIRTQETTAIYHVFGGYTLGTVKCMSCGYVSKNFQSTLDIPLEVTGKISSVEEALEVNYCTEETLEGSNKYKCSKCKTLVRAKKAAKIHVSPNVLMIPLKRYSTGRFSKITKYVSYPSTLSLGPFMSEDAPYEVTPPNYELFGVLVHQDFYASAHSGHYVAYVKLQNPSCWVLCNDNRISPATEKDALKQKAYILFYERVELRGAPPIRPPGYLDEFKMAREMAPTNTILTDDLRRTLEAMQVTAKSESSISEGASHRRRVSPRVDQESPAERQSADSEPDNEEHTIEVETEKRTIRIPYKLQTIKTVEGEELKLTITLLGCVSTKMFDVELKISDNPLDSGGELIISAPTVYKKPFTVNLPGRLSLTPTRSAFKKGSSQYHAQFRILS
jgi:hypothetical protein